MAPVPLRLQLHQELLSEEALQQASGSLPGTAAAVLLADALLCCGQLPSHKVDQMMVDLWAQAQQVGVRGAAPVPPLQPLVLVSS